MMICTRCKVPKEESEFRIVKSHGKEHRRRHCRKCEYEIHTVWGRNNIVKVMIQSAKFRAKRDQVPFDITAEDIFIPECCPVFGVKLEQGTRREHENSPSLDRLVPEKGYIRGNIRVVSHLANMLKSKATADQLRKLADYMEVDDDLLSRVITQPC